jgi:hypothetical protein
VLEVKPGMMFTRQFECYIGDPMARGSNNSVARSWYPTLAVERRR